MMTIGYYRAMLKYELMFLYSYSKYKLNASLYNYKQARTRRRETQPN